MNRVKAFSVVLTGGGTGGHIYPAIAVAQVLKNDPEITRIYYIGCARNPEKDIAEKEGLEFYPINVSGMPRKPGLKFLAWCFELLTATLVAVRYLSRVKPDAVFGTGGYVTGPVLIAARLLGIPYVIHDPDAYPGMVNKLMSKWAESVSLAFEDAKIHIKNQNIKIRGNPVRKNLGNTGKNTAKKELGLNPDKKTILAIGGSQGAKTINDAISGVVPVFINEFGFQVIHQTGKKNFDEYIKNFYEKNPGLRENPAYLVKPYFEDMSLPLNAADIAVSRAGSLSISELNLCELPAVLIPYPYAAADHQRFNAKAMENSGASLYLEDAQCSPEKLVELINSVLSNPDKFNEMKKANKSLAKPDSASHIVREIKRVAVLKS